MIDSSPSLRNKKDLIENFVDFLSVDGSVQDEWQAYVQNQCESELEKIIASENLKREQTLGFVDLAFTDGVLRSTGTEVTKILPPMSRFSRERNYGEKKRRVIEKLTVFLNGLLE